MPAVPAGPEGSEPASVASLARDDAAWDAFVARSSSPSHLQSTAWARAKAVNGWRPLRVVVDGGSGPIGAQVLVRKLGPGPFAVGYAGRGPIATRFDAASVAAFSVALKRVGRRHRLTHITVDPALEEGSGAGALLQAAGWRRADDIQHDGSRLIDLRKPESELAAALRSTTRRYVNKARREGITVTDGDSSDLPTFHAILVETARRGGFVHRSLESYQSAFEAFRTTGGSRLLFARLPDGTPVAAKLLLGCGGVVSQPYSGMTAQGATSRANYLLEWETIRSSAELGFATYDMWGLANPGIVYFKAGFGGREVRYVGARDLVTLPLLRDGLVKARRGYIWAARKRHGLRGATDEATEPKVPADAAPA